MKLQLFNFEEHRETSATASSPRKHAGKGVSPQGAITRINAGRKWCQGEPRAVVVQFGSRVRPVGQQFLVIPTGAIAGVERRGTRSGGIPSGHSRVRGPWAVGEGQGCFDFALRFAALAPKAARSMTKSWDSQTELLPLVAAMARLGSRVRPVEQEIPRPAGENAGLRDDARCGPLRLIPSEPLPSKRS